MDMTGITRQRMDRAPKILFLFVLIFAPLAFGTRASWSLFIVSTAICIAFIICLVQARQGKVTLYEIPGILPLLLLACYMCFQIIPLPAFLVKFLSPETYKLYKNTMGISYPLNFLSFSINKKATLYELCRFLTCVLFYILTVWLFSEKEFMKKTVRLVIFLAASIAVLAILQYFLSNNRIYWFRTVPVNATPFGPWVYHNHFAGFMEMILPTSICLFLYYKPNTRKKVFRKKVQEIFAHKRINLHILFGFSAILIGASVFVSYSRGGIISMCISVFILTLMLFFRGRGGSKESGILFAAIIIAILLSVGWFGWEVIFDRFSKIRNADGYIDLNRLLVWEDILSIIKDFPVFGTGFGTFVYIYPGYRTAHRQFIFNHAHNDYLELATDGGIIAIVLAVWFIASLLLKVWRKFRIRRERYSIFLFYGVIAGLVALAIHSISDFNLHNGANSIYFSFMVGLLVSSSHTRIKALSDTYLTKVKTNRIEWITIPASCLLAIVPVFFLSDVIGAYNFSKVADILLNDDISKKELGKIEKTATLASTFDPLEAKYYYGLGNISFYLSEVASAEGFYKKALHLNPVKGEYLQRLGLLMAHQNKNSIAERLFLAGIERDMHMPARYKTYSYWLMSSNDRKKSAKLLKKANSLDPSRENTMECIELMSAYHFTPKEMLIAIPEKPLPAIFYAEYFEKNGFTFAADTVYQKISHYISLSGKPRAWYFMKIKTYYLKKGQIDDALNIMTQAVEQMPDNVKIRVAAGDLYKKAGITYRAKEEYRKALAIDPASITARKRLNHL
jgi:O-antigen ligase/Tfp pilus assembly protein PilF